MVTGLLCMTLFGTPAFAALGKISGTVTDAASGEPLPGVNVQISGTQMGAVTNLQGQYFILNVPPGSYTIKYSFMGYTGQDIQGVIVNLDRTTELSVKLKQTVISGETMTVLATRPAIDKTMTATKVTFSDEQVNNVLPAASLNEILQTSVTAQAMRGASKRGVGYMIDGINVADVYWPSGGGGFAYSFVKHDDTPTTASSTTYDTQDPNAPPPSSLVKTVGSVAQSSVQEANVIAGTVNAEYAASGGVINLASKDGSDKLSVKAFLRSSMGGLKHAGPDVYDAIPEQGIFGGKSAAQHFIDYRNKLLNAKKADGTPDAQSVARGQQMLWQPGMYPYGEDPRINAELNIGGPMTSKGNFFFSGQLLDDHGRFPGEFQRQVSTALKLNYYITPTNKLTWMGKVDDGGKLLGWKNRQFTGMYMFYLEGQPVNDKLGLMSYLKWVKNFNPSSFLETNLSFVSTHRTYGYAPVDGKLKFGEYGDWIILDTIEKSKQYIVDLNTRIFNPAPGNDQVYTLDEWGNQTRFGSPGYLYEDIKTSVLTAKTDFTKQVNFNHQLKAGLEYNYVTLDNFQHGAAVGGTDARYPFYVQSWKINPWNFGTYLQDRIEYQGIIVNLGVRLDGYNMGSKMPANIFAPAHWDSLANGQKTWFINRDKAAKTHVYASPRLGVSHPITESAAMHYSWGIYTTRPAYLQSFQEYSYWGYPSLPALYNADMDPERAYAYEIGLNVALTKDFGGDLTAYYRDTRNASTIAYNIGPLPGTSGGGTMYYYTNWGYRDSRGFELNLWKRPQAEKYFGVVGVSGNLSLSYSYDKGSSFGGGMVTDGSARTALKPGTTDEAYDLDRRYQFPSYSRGFNYWNGKLTMMFDFPYDIRLSTLTTYRSKWFFAKTLDVKNSRYEEWLDGEPFFQTDVRLFKYVTFGRTKIGVFVEALNVFDRLNVLTFDNYNNVLYETKQIPWGLYWRPMDAGGNPFAGIAREIYAGIEFTL